MEAFTRKREQGGAWRNALSMLLVGEERSDRREDPRSDPESACANHAVITIATQGPELPALSRGKRGLFHAHALPRACSFTKRGEGLHLQRVENGQTSFASTQVSCPRVVGPPRMPLRKG